MKVFKVHDKTLQHGILNALAHCAVIEFLGPGLDELALLFNGLEVYIAVNFSNFTLTR